MNRYTMGLDVGSTYTKGILIDESKTILARYMEATTSQLVNVSEQVANVICERAGLSQEEIDYTITTGYGRHLVPFRDLQVTDLTAGARGANHLFPRTQTILDIGGQTMKASRIDDRALVKTFRLNDKCASGTGAFLEKTARYMGYSTDEIGRLLELSKSPVPISGVCAVFAESEVISHLSEGVPPEDIMFGAIQSLTRRCIQLVKRVKAEPEYTLIGGILRWKSMGRAVQEELNCPVNIPAGDMAQYTPALGCAILGQLRLDRLESQPKSGKVSSQISGQK